MKELGADEIQGDFFSKPLPTADIGALMGGNTFASLMAGDD